MHSARPGASRPWRSPPARDPTRGTLPTARPTRRRSWLLTETTLCPRRVPRATHLRHVPRALTARKRRGTTSHARLVRVVPDRLAPAEQRGVVLVADEDADLVAVGIHGGCGHPDLGEHHHAHGVLRLVAHPVGAGRPGRNDADVPWL